MTQEYLLSPIKIDNLLAKIEQVIDAKLKAVLSVQQQSPKTKYLSRKEVAEHLKISLPTLNDWSKLGWLQSYKIGNRVLYKQDEVEQALHKVGNLKHKKVLFQ